MIGKLWIIFLTFLDISGSVADPECRPRFVHYDHHLGTKSAYRQPTKPPSIEGGCHFERIWLMIRHGTRAPSSKVIQQMNERLPYLRKLILQNVLQGRGPGFCDDDIAALEAWKPRLKKMHEKSLSAAGEEEMIRLAENYQSYFPDLFPGNYTTDSYLFRYTATQRTAASARAFTVGLFGRIRSHHVHYPAAVKKDSVLRFYKLCKYWKKQIHDNPSALEEKRKFESGSEMLHTLVTISRHLNLNFTLSIEDVRLLYVTCAFETALYPREKSPWCVAFSEENLRVMEFAEDLEYYWIDGYGHNITYELACPAVRDIARRIIPSLIPEGTPPTAVYFTHSGALLKLMSRMGLYKDYGSFTHDRYQSLHSRLWKVSNIDTFGSNLAFVLARCDDGYYVLTLHQERVVQLPVCDQNLCPLHIFLNYVWDIIHGCDFMTKCFP